MAVDYTAPPLLSVRDLQVTLPAAGGTLHLARDVSYDVWRGETLAIVGESGSGKSVNAAALMGLQPRRARVNAARLRFDGRDLPGLTHRQLARLRGNDMAMIFQDPMTSLNPVLTIGEQLVETWAAHGLGTRREAEERAVFLLERVGISNAAGRMRQYPHQLSGGLRQRVVIAIAMMCRPKLLIADEPTTALDVTVQALILSLLRELQVENDMALILITHDMGVVSSVADRVAIMYAGTLMETGPAAAAIGDPVHPYTRGLLDCIPRLDPDVQDAPLATIPGVVASLAEHRDECAFLNRCPLAENACAAGWPGMRGFDESRAYRCVRGVNELRARWRAAAGAAA